MDRKRWFLLLAACIGLGGMAVAQPANDNYSNAINVTAYINGCSPNAAYTTVNATADKYAGSNWNNSGPRYNVWFKFTAPASGAINVTVDRGGAQGNQRRTQLAIWQPGGNTEIASTRYANNNDDVSLSTGGLTPGTTYYISVDTYSNSYDGTFTLCLQDQVDYDFYEGAVDVTGFINGCSADAAYTTEGATPDKNAGSNWNNSGPRYNRWFKFTAPASGAIDVTVDIGGAKGDQQRTQAAIWQANGTTEIASARYAGNNDDVTVNATGLTPGNTYYISVDTYSNSYDGTFTLCLQTPVDYDFYAGAIDVTGFINGCSADAAYTTVGATPDKNAGSNWNNSGPKFNRWFTFTAPASGVIDVTVDIGGAKGSQLRTQVAIWQADGTTEVASARYAANNDDVTVSATGLIPGNTYYISVDTYSGSYTGTFTLCLQAPINDVDGDGVDLLNDLDADNDGIPNLAEGYCTPIANNSDVESPVVSGPTPYLADYGGHVRTYDASYVPYWETTAPDNAIEVWDSQNTYTSPHANAYSGNQFMELNANYAASNYQDLATTPNSVLTWSVAHRGRQGVDVATVSIGPPGSVTVQQTMSTGNTAWVVYTGTYVVPSGQTVTRFQFDAVSTSNGQITSGNFIDAFTVACNNDIDTDGDGLPDYLDLDSDNDGIYDVIEAGHGALDADQDGRIDGAPAAFGSNGLYNGLETSPDSGVINYTIKDSDGDGNYDTTELDSDNDGCNDVMEAGFIDSDGDGTPGAAPIVVDGNGVVTSLSP